MTLTRAIVRAISGAPKLPERVPMGGDRSRFMGSGGLMGGSAQSGMQAYNEIGAVYGPIRRICESVSLVNWTLYQQTDKKGETDRQKIDDAKPPAHHPATALWTKPNPFMTRRFFMYVQQLWQETCGGCYWLLCEAGEDPSPFKRKVTCDLELWPIRSDKLIPVKDPDKYLLGYLYVRGIEKIPLPISAVFPIGYPDPTDLFRFSGPLGASAVDLESEKLAAQYIRNVFYNNGEPGGVVQFDTPLTDIEFEAFVTRWREQHQGVSNARRVAIIEGGKWESVAQSNAELQYIDLRKFTREEVMFARAMPFAVMVTQDVNLANADAGMKLYYSDTVRPPLELAAEALNVWALPYIGDDLTFDFELPVPSDPAFDVYASATGWLSGLLNKNEAREGLGFDSLDGDDGEVYVYELEGATPPALPPPPTPPKRPTRLSYDRPASGFDVEQRTKLMATVRQNYAELVAGRNGR